ncbi:MAG TPA: glycosyltransferase family 2 protein [Anaeromyxobacteraceae bacterium]|nr:glycosyltransferase family 2 protein [Anaeromyxobacteraceae bacterium]
MTFRACAVVPTYDNPRTVGAVVEELARHVPAVIVVDDGSGAEGRAAVDDLVSRGLAVLRRHERNRGKGAAVKTALVAARELGFTHALQVDADGQHDLKDVPRFLEAAKAAPGSVVLGEPVFDASVPPARLRGRKVSVFWTTLETGSRIIRDPLCGFRVYPVEAALRAGARGNRMEFDPEIAVRLAWAGTPVLNLPTRVRYLAPEEGGVSHFRMFRDNAWISWGHTRLCTLAVLRALLGRGRRRT